MKRRLYVRQFLLLCASSLLVPLLSGAADARKPVLDTPSALVVSRATPTSLDFAWQAAPGAGSVHYNVYLNGAKAATGLQTFKYTFSALTCGTSYALGVAAAVNGQQSAVATLDGTTSACASSAPPSDSISPSAPAAVHLFSVADTSVATGWTASTDNVGVVGYGVYLSGKKLTAATTTSYTYTGLTCGSALTVGVDAVDAAGNRSAITQVPVKTAACAAPAATTTTTTTTTTTATTTTTITPPTQPPASGASLFVSPSGSDANPCTQAAPCASLDGAYQRASAGSVVQVASGTYPYQQIKSRVSLRDLSPGCTSDATAQCVRFVGSGVKINGQIELHGSDVWIDGGVNGASPGFDVRGRIDTEADSNSIYPDHVIVQGTHSTSLSIFNTDTATFRWMDVGPATVSTGCAVVEGAGGENMIGFADGVTVVPRNIVIDGIRLHDQNGDAGRIAEDCHWGGLFLVTVNGLTIKRSIFERNVVYNVEIQNFVGPPATNVTFSGNSFGCPVDWLYNGAPCDGQSSIQFDGTFPGITITNNAFADGSGWWGQGYGCYRDPCDFSGDSFTLNLFGARSTTAPSLP